MSPSPINTTGSHISCTSGNWMNERVTLEVKLKEYFKNKRPNYKCFLTSRRKNSALGKSFYGKKIWCFPNMSFDAFQSSHLITFVSRNCAVKYSNNLKVVLTQYWIEHLRTCPGRSAKFYVNPLNDLFRPPTIAIQRWLAGDTGAHLSFCPGLSLSVAPPTVIGVG